MNSLLAAAVTAFLFTSGDPQLTLDTQYRAYTKAQAFFPERINKYRDRALNKKRRLPKSAHTFINANIDWELYASSIFRPNWDELTKKQQAQFINLLQRDAISRYGKLFTADLTFSVQFRGQTEYKMLRGHEFARVNTTLKSTKSDAEVDVSFIFRKGETRWALCDVYIDGVSKAKSWRRSVRRIYKKEGYSGVVKAFQKRS